MARVPLIPALAVVVATGLGLPLSGQLILPPPPRPADPVCEQRLNAALSLDPAVTRDSLVAVLSRLDACVPELGRGIAAAAVAFRGTSDTATAMIILHSAAMLRDSAAFRASRSLVADPSASDLMRVSAMRILLSYVSPAHVTSITELSRHSAGALFCSLTSAGTRATDVVELSPVPPSAAQEARDAARVILANAAAPAAVRSAAYCVVEAWREVGKLPSNAYWPFDALQLSVENTCATQYRFRNMHPVPIALQYGTPSWPAAAKGRITLLAPPAGASFSEVTITVGPGSLTVYLDGAPIKTVADTARPCQ